VKIDLNKIQDKRHLRDLLSSEIERLDKYIARYEKSGLPKYVYSFLYKQRDDLRYLHKKVNKAYSIEQNKEK